MQITRHLKQIYNSKQPPSVLTIGNFDGMHLGHQQIINTINKIAQEKNLCSTILSFQPHPIKLFKPDLAKDFNIFTLAQKLRFFCEKKIAHSIILPFNKNFSEISAENFIKNILVETLNVKYLVIGYDFIFGKNREGNFQMLQDYAKRYNFNIINIEAHKINDEICSSTLVRKSLQNGKLEAATAMLGKKFSLQGIVIEGKKLAREIGFPTANFRPLEHIIKPKFGVYRVEIFLPHLQKAFFGVMNFGLKPTIGKDSQPLYEVYIFDFNEVIYGKKIEVKLLNYIREEKKFESLDALKQQIRMDIVNSKNL